MQYFRGIRGLAVYREEIYLVAEKESGFILLVLESTARTQLSTGTLLSTAVELNKAQLHFVQEQ